MRTTRMTAYVHDPFEDDAEEGLDEDQWYSDSSDAESGWGEDEETDEPDVEETEDEADESGDDNWE